MTDADGDRISLWLAETATPASGSGVTPPRLPARVDVVVVGAGLAGLCTALLCLEQGATVAVIEAGAVAGRTTGHSTAKLTALHGLTYARLRRGKGADAAAAYAAANLEALSLLREHIARLGIDCGLVDATAYTCASTAEGVGAIEEEADAAAAAGLPVEVVTSTELALPVERAVALAGQAHFNPVAFATAVAAHLRRRGAHVLEHTPVTAVEESRQGCTVRGPAVDVACDHAVIATHLPVVDPALLAARVRPERSYVVAGPSPGRTVPTGMYLSHDQGWSLRPWSSPEGPMLLVGGEGHRMTDHVDGQAHYTELCAFAAGQLGVDVRYQWSAFDYATTDGVPYIGRLSPTSRRRYTATGFHKWGMTTSMVAAMIISDSIAGRTNPYQQTFDSTRIAPTVTRDLAAITAAVAVRFVGDRITARRGEVALPGPGEGLIVRRGTSTVALARDRSGQLHALKAACTHLGCIVGFNAAEQTWDCPCHGSRFGLDGAVIDGPARDPLEHVPDLVNRGGDRP